MTIRNTFVAGLLMTIIAMPAMAWERTDETKLAANGAPLVKMVAERGDTLGEPWLQYLQLIGYDVSGNWWVNTAQSLLELNPDGTFVSGTYYGISAGSSWWLPDVAAMQAAAESATTTATPADANPFVRQGDFVALSDALTQDLAALKQFQQDAETRLGERIDAIETAQAATAIKLEAATGRIDGLEAWRTQTDTNLTNLSDQVFAAVISADQAMRTAEETQETVNGLRTDIVTEVAAGQSRLTLAAIVAGLALLALIGLTTWFTLRRIKNVDQAVRRDVATANIKLHSAIEQQSKRLDVVADELMPSLFNRAMLEPALLAQLNVGGSFLLAIKAKSSDQQYQLKIERVVFDGGNGAEDRVMIHGLSRRDDRFEQMQPVTFKNAAAKVEEGIVKGRLQTLNAIAAA